MRSAKPFRFEKQNSLRLKPLNIITTDINLNVSRLSQMSMYVD